MPTYRERSTTQINPFRLIFTEVLMTGYRRTEVEIAVVSDVNFRRPLVIPSGSHTAQVDSQPQHRQHHQQLTTA